MSRLRNGTPIPRYNTYLARRSIDPNSAPAVRKAASVPEHHIPHNVLDIVLTGFRKSHPSLPDNDCFDPLPSQFSESRSTKRPSPTPLTIKLKSGSDEPAPPHGGDNDSSTLRVPVIVASNLKLATPKKTLHWGINHPWLLGQLWRIKECHLRNTMSTLPCAYIPKSFSTKVLPRFRRASTRGKVSCLSSPPIHNDHIHDTEPHPHRPTRQAANAATSVINSFDKIGGWELSKRGSKRISGTNEHLRLDVAAFSLASSGGACADYMRPGQVGALKQSLNPFSLISPTMFYPGDTVIPPTSWMVLFLPASNEIHGQEPILPGPLCDATYLLGGAG
ncbi:hypothetical protein ARMSODRAFT_983607 [Armillaria solidipes]|uniref:Uncharacterized protein n=1 Tax=Armillaria solidipes TaxID=1076256 RepID=A0A2H3AIL4_9AGAR|nr:hypothetical protein ARMSODRAFT_983607 [Armillaria solidipes]